MTLHEFCGVTHIYIYTHMSINQTKYGKQSII